MGSPVEYASTVGVTYISDISLGVVRLFARGAGLSIQGLSRC